MRYILKIFSALLIMAAISVSVTACGKISSPEPVEGSGYPHSYPRR